MFPPILSRTDRGLHCMGSYVLIEHFGTLLQVPFTWLITDRVVNLGQSAGFERSYSRALIYESPPSLAMDQLRHLIRGWFSQSAQAAGSSRIQLNTGMQVKTRQLNDSLYEVYKPAGAPSMQILFFHGLQSPGDSLHAHLQTWESADGSCWPQTWLAEEFPGAHILFVSYPTDMGKNPYNDIDIDKIGENLLADLMQAKIGQMPYCPLVLVGHSLGGLVIRQICSQAYHMITRSEMARHSSFLGRQIYSQAYHMTTRSEMARLSYFLESVKGFFFYGTPTGSPDFANVRNDMKTGAVLQNSSLELYFKILRTEKMRIDMDFEYVLETFSEWKIGGLQERLPKRLGFQRSFDAWTLRIFDIVEEDHFSITKPRSKTSRIFWAFRDFLLNIQVRRVGDGEGLREIATQLEDVRPNFETSIMRGIGEFILKIPFFSELHREIREVKKTVQDLEKAERKGKSAVVDEPEVSGNDEGQVVDLTRRAKEFIREMEKGGQDGYFVSSKCLLSLEQSQQQSLKTILWEAGYSEIYQTTTTILFARNAENRITHYDASSMLKENVISLDEVGVPEVADDLLGTTGRALDISRNADNIANIFGFDDSAGTSTSTDHARRSLEEEISPATGPLARTTLRRKDDFEDDLSQGNSITERLEPTPTPTSEWIEKNQQTSLRAMSPKPPRRINLSLAEQQAATWRSLKGVLESKSHPSFCVSTRWLSNLKDHEKNALSSICLEAGYRKIYETSTKTWYERIRVRMPNPADGGWGDGSSSSSNKSDASGGNVTTSGASESGRSLVSRKGKSEVDNDDDTSGSHAVATMERSRNEDESFPCHPQRLRVACSTATTSRVISVSEDEIVMQHGDEQRGPEVVTLPNLQGRSVKLISTSIVRRFSIPTINFSSEGKAEEVTASMNAKAISSLSCCLRIDRRHPKVRIKFSEISGEVKGINLNEQQDNGVILSCLGTTVYGCTRRTDNEGDFEQIALDLDDEYRRPRGRVVERVRGDHTKPSDIDLVWLEMSSNHAKNRRPGSVTLALRGDVDERLNHDLQTKVERAHTLSFYNTKRPTIFEGNIDEDRRLDSFLQLQIRYKLEVCYFKPCITSREQALYYPCQLTPQTIDFDCYLRIRSENFLSE